MKKLLLLTAAVILVACGKSPEEKAQALIEDAVKKSLYIPKSYDPVETKIDSAFAPHATQDYINGTIEMCKAYKELKECESEVKSAKSSLNIYSDSYARAYMPNEYRDHKAEYDAALSKKDRAEKHLGEIIEGLRKMEEQKPEFIGYSAIHRYRANTNGGQTVFGTVQFFLDKDISKIVASYDLDSYDFKEMQETLEEMKNDGMFEQQKQ